MRKIFTYFIVALLLCVFGASAAQAKFAIPTTTNTGLPATTDINSIIKNVVQWFLALVGIVALLTIVWAGVTYMTSGGDEEKVGKAKQRLTYGILGVVVAIAGLVIVVFIYNLVNADLSGTGPAL